MSTKKKPEIIRETIQAQHEFTDALTAAAAGMELPKISFSANEITLSSAEAFVKEFSRAAKFALWPIAAIRVMRDVLKKCATPTAMHETLRPHIAEAKPELTPEKAAEILTT